MKKFFLGLALLAMATLSLAACTGGEEAAPAEEAADAVEEPVVEPVVEEEAAAEDAEVEAEVEVDAEATVK